MGKTKNKLTVLFISLFFSLLLIEVILRLTYPLYSNYAMEMWRYGVNLKKQAFDRAITHEHIPSKSFRFYGVEIKTNSLGLRSDREYLVPKPQNIKRILVLGDSITMGWGVSFKETYPYILETLINKGSKLNFEVINSGVGNYNSASELSALKRLSALEPDMIILGFYINDLEDIRPSSGLSYFLSRHSYLYAFIWSKLINIKYYYPNNDYQSYYSKLYQDPNLRFKAMDAINQMIEIANKRRIPFVFINIPEMHSFKEGSFQAAGDFTKEIKREHPEIIFVDLAEILKGNNARDFWVSSEDPHPNANLHRIIAESVYSSIGGK